MKTVYIVGGDGFARECFSFFQAIVSVNSDVRFGGFMGHGEYGKTVDYKTFQHLYIGEVSEHEFNENEFVIIGAGYPEVRIRIYNELKSRGVQFYNLISIDSQLVDTIALGEANVIISSSISVNVNIGIGNVFNLALIGHDSQIGNFNFLGPRSQLLGNTRVGNFNQIGANSILLPKSRIGNNNIIAPLSAIYKGCKDNCYMLGNPALKHGTVQTQKSDIFLRQ